MQTLILLSNSDITIRHLMEAASTAFQLKWSNEDEFSIESQRPDGTIAYVTFRKFENPCADYDPEVVFPFPVGSQTRGFLVEFNDLFLLREVMPSFRSRDDVAVHDDHGTIVLGKKFVSDLRNSVALAWLPRDYASGGEMNGIVDINSDRQPIIRLQRASGPHLTTPK